MVDSGKIKLIGVTAAGGFGKSALVAKFYLNLKGFTQKIWTSFSQAYSFAVWGRWLLDRLEKSAPDKDEDLIVAVCNALASERCLLVWDNLETLLNPDRTNPARTNADGNWVDNGYLQFLLSWFSSHSESIILVTSREQPNLPANTLNQSKWLSLDGLNVDAGVALLQALNISGDDVDLQQFVQDADGHPLLLKLAAGILHAEEGENPDITALHENIFEILGLHRHDPEASISKILDASISRLRPELQLFLGRLSVYRLPFDREAAGVMWSNLTPESSAIADSEQEQDLPTDNLNTVIATSPSNPKPLEIRNECVSPEEIEKELRKLAKRCLLQERKEARKQERTWIFQFQPLIQEYLQQKISDEEKEIAHQQAITYYEQHRKPQLKSTDELDAVTEYLEIFHHNCEIGHYLPAFNIIQQRTKPDELYSSCDYLLQLRGYNSIRLNLYERLLAQWRPETDEEKRYRADAVRAIGDVLQFLKRIDGALNRYQDALEYYRQIGDGLGEANTLIAIGDVLQFLDRREETLNLYQEALEYYRQIGDSLGEANTLKVIGDALQFLDRRDKALNCYQEALEYYCQIGDRLGQANTLKAIGDVLQFLKRSDEALNRYQEALEFYRQIGDRLGQANTLKAIGDVLQFLKRSNEALKRYQDALEFYRQIGAKLGEANTLIAIGSALQFLNRYDETLNHYQKALEYYRHIGDRLGEANTLKAIGDVLELFNRHNEALHLYQKALEYYHQIGNRFGKANTLKAIGDVLQFLKRSDEALNRYQDALECYRQIKDRFGKANTLEAIGDVLQFLKRSDEALNHYQKALEYYRQIGERLGEANILQEFGKLESNPQRSLEYLQQAQTLYIQISHIYSQSRNLLFIADAQLNLEDKDAAISSLNQASELADSINYQPFQEYAANKIAEIQNPPKPENPPKPNLWSFVRRVIGNE